eukprot:602891-Pyramimonas_sp.AAC.1
MSHLRGSPECRGDVIVTQARGACTSAAPIWATTTTWSAKVRAHSENMSRRSPQRVLNHLEGV